MTTEHNSSWEHWPWLLFVAFCGWIIWLLAPILTPFAASALLAYLADPLVDKLETFKLSRTTSVVVVFVLMTLVMVMVVLGLLPLLEGQVNYLVQRLPTYIDWLRDTALPWVTTRMNVDLVLPESDAILSLIQEHWRSAGGMVASVLDSLSKSSLVLVGWIANLTLIPVVTFYLLRDWDVLIENVKSLIPKSMQSTVGNLATDSDLVLGAFIRGQLLVMLALGTVYVFGLWAVGLKLALLIGLLAGLLSIVPYLGTIVGILAGLIAAIVQFGDWQHTALVGGVFVIGQILEGMLLTPWLVGDRIGLHPVAVIFSVMAGGVLFGFLGVLLALPVAAVLMVLLRHTHKRYLESRLYMKDEIEEEETTQIITSDLDLGSVTDNGKS